MGDVVKDLITKCLVQNPKERLTAVEALKHPFFKEDLDRGTPAAPREQEGEAKQRTSTSGSTSSSGSSSHHLTKTKASVEDVTSVIDHLWAFSALGKLRKVVLLAVSQSMTTKEISKLNTVFEELDITKGTLLFYFSIECARNSVWCALLKSIDNILCSQTKK